MYWGVTHIILSPVQTHVKTNTSQICQKQLLVFVYIAQLNVNFHVHIDVMAFEESFKFLSSDLFLLH